MDYGGFGGIAGGREFNLEDKFESDVNDVLGDKLRNDKSLCNRMWGSLANVTWHHENGDTASYSFRAAGDLIAAVVNNGTDYLDYYCSSTYPLFDEEIMEAMATKGWSPDGA